MQINWSLRELDVFVALAATLSFRRTAAQVNLSQSAVSGVVTRLEETLAVWLSDRTTRNVQLMATGQVFAEQALLLRAQTDEAVPRRAGGFRADGGQSGPAWCAAVWSSLTFPV